MSFPALNGDPLHWYSDPFAVEQAVAPPSGDTITATADASLSADYAALLQPQPVALAATPDASGAADYAGAIQPTPVTLTASSDLSAGADYAATITEVDAPVVLQASADLSVGADYAASVVPVPVTISIGFDASLGADFAASIPRGFVRRLRPADEALHEALYSRLRSLLDAAGYTDVPVFDRLPDAGRAPTEKPTAMPYVVIVSLDDEQRGTWSTRGQRFTARLLIYSSARTRREIYQLKETVVAGLDRHRFDLSAAGHVTIKAFYERGPIRPEPDAAQGRDLLRADLELSYWTQQTVEA